MEILTQDHRQTQSHTRTQILLAGKHTAMENTVSLVSCLNTHHLLMVDIALTSLMTEKPSLLCHSRSELRLFHSVRALVPQFLTCGKDNKEVHALSQRKYQNLIATFERFGWLTWQPWWKIHLYIRFNITWNTQNIFTTFIGLYFLLSFLFWIQNPWW